MNFLKILFLLFIIFEFYDTKLILSKKEQKYKRKLELLLKKKKKMNKKLRKLYA